MNPLRKTGFLWNTVFAFTLLVYAVGLFVTVMEPDAALYALTSMEMHQSGNYLEIFLKGNDWLDKPHFQFWATALSYAAFGVNTIAYKLPAIFFSLIAVLYTYLFACRYYSKQHGFLAALILMTAQHIITSNMDVRAEPYMTGLTIMALYHFAVYLNSKKFLHLLAGCVGLACLIMTKGLFTIIPVAAGVGGALLYKLRWREIFHWQWLVAIGLTLFFIAPALYGYYIQFDQHPEKEVFGKYGVSGIEFFLWSSQWGRFVNTGPIRGAGDPFYFVHTLLWAFAPWAFLAFYAIFQKTKQLFRKIQVGEHYTYFGFVVMFLLFSASRFQLAHYLNAVFPLLAIITSFSLVSLLRNKKLLKIFTGIQLFHCVVFLVALVMLQYFFSGDLPHADSIIIISAGVLTAVYLFILKGQWAKKIIFGSALMILVVNYFLNREFYPKLLTYQSESEMGFYFKKQKLPAGQLVSLDGRILSTDVILGKVIPGYRLDEASPDLFIDKYVFTTENGLYMLDSLGMNVQLLRSFDDYPITTLDMKFINRKTREKELGKRFLVKVSNKE